MFKSHEDDENIARNLVRSLRSRKNM